MKDHRGFVLFEHGFNEGKLLDLTEHRHIIGEVVLMVQFHLNGVEIFFTCIKQDNAFWGKTKNLPAQFRADGTTGPGDKDGLAGQVAADFFLVKTDFFSAQ